MYLTDIYATRRANLSRLVESKRYASTQKDFAQRIGKAPAQVNQWLTKRRNIGEGTRDDIEDTLGLPRGWLDVDRSDAATELDLPAPPAAPAALTLAQALPVVLAHLPGLSEYRAGQVIQALQAAARSAAPLDQIERDLLQWLTEPRTAAPATATPGLANRAAA